MGFDVVGLGLCTVDHLGVVEALPAFDEVAFVSDYDRQGGGPVATALVTLARLGARVAYLGKRGDDGGGRTIHADFVRYGVDDRSVVLPGVISPLSHIAVEHSTGQRAIFFYLGSAGELEPHELDRGLIASARYLHLDGWFPSAALQAATWAREDGVTVVLDGTMANPHSQALVSLTDVLIADANFPRQLTGLDDPESAGRALLAMGPRIVVITLGSKGALALSGEKMLRQPAFSVSTVDTTGAGDVFHGAFIFGLLQDWSLVTVLRFASATAALKCTRMGGRAGVPTLAEVEAFLQEAEK